jgi:NADH:ubiquinone oxidoreductase subunit E
MENGQAKQVQISICMGSSCFSRGNNRNVELIRSYLDGKAGKACELQGHLCRDQCTRGPNVAFDSREHHGVDPLSLVRLLQDLESSKC